MEDALVAVSAPSAPNSRSDWLFEFLCKQTKIATCEVMRIQDGGS